MKALFRAVAHAQAASELESAAPRPDAGDDWVAAFGLVPEAERARLHRLALSELVLPCLTALARHGEHGSSGCLDTEASLRVA